jgi:NurA-like 5'-3' nuclease
MDDYFKSLEFTVFYLRLNDYKNVVKVELPYKASGKEVEKVISIIKKESIEGYPYLLKKAHSEVVIHNKNILELAEIVGLYEKSGREMLN